MSGGVVAIVIVAIVASMIVRLVKIQHGVDADRRRRRDATQSLTAPEQSGARELELQREVEALRERVHVLERIATDEHKPQALAAEIESLRDR